MTRKLEAIREQRDQAETRIAAALTVCDRWHDHDLPLAALRAALTDPHQLTPGEPA